MSKAEKVREEIAYTNNWFNRESTKLKAEIAMTDEEICNSGKVYVFKYNWEDITESGKEHFGRTREEFEAYKAKEIAESLAMFRASHSEARLQAMRKEYEKKIAKLNVKLLGLS